MPTDLDVLIVGGGPVGLFAAHQLCQHGVSPDRIRVIDKRPLQKKWCKAVTIHPRTREMIYSSSESLSRALDACVEHIDSFQSNRYQSARQTFAETEKIITGHFGNLSSQYNYMSITEQYTTETLIAKDLKDKHGVTLERGIQLIGFEDKGSFVTAKLKKAPSDDQKEEGIEELTAKYLIGADGAHSFVRSQLNLPFLGETYTENFIVWHGELNNDDQLPFPGVQFLTGVNGFLFLISLKDHTWYCVIDLNEEEMEKANARHNGKMTQPNADDINECFASRGMKGITVKSSKWLSAFKIHSRQITQYSKGRVYLAGDACHVHSPIGGQGMNMGLQDSANLAWKLALVINKQCGASLLTSYNTERHSVDKSVLKLVDAQTKQGLERDRLMLMLSKRMQKTIASFQFLLDAQLATTAQITYTYKDNSELSFEYWKTPSIVPYILYRRQQNITRLIRKRLCAGDRCPDFIIPAMDGKANEDFAHQRLYALFRDAVAKPFVVLLFEGNKEFEVRMTDYSDLRAFKQEIERSECGEYCKVVIIESVHAKLMEMFGVYQQCMFLVRPDLYLGLRSQPIAMDALKYYMTKKLFISNIRIGDEEVMRLKNVEKVDVNVPIVFLTATVLMGLSYFIGNKTLPNEYKPKEVLGKYLWSKLF